MKIIILIISAALFINQVLTSPLAAESSTTVSETSTEVAVAPIIDIFAVIRAIINGVIQSLQTAALSSGQSIQDMLNMIRDQKLSLLGNLNTTLEAMTGDAEAAFQQIATTVEIIMITTTECSTQQNVVIERILSNVTTSVGECIETIRDEISGSFTGIWNSLESVVYTAIDLANQITTCGVASFGDLLATGTCLSEVLTLGQTLANNNIVQLATAIANVFTTITSAPTNLAVCAGSHVAASALAGSNVIAEITKCSASAIASMS